MLKTKTILLHVLALSAETIDWLLDLIIEKLYNEFEITGHLEVFKQTYRAMNRHGQDW